MDACAVVAVPNQVPGGVVLWLVDLGLGGWPGGVLADGWGGDDPACHGVVD